jgi:hypothetical protein
MRILGNWFMYVHEELTLKNSSLAVVQVLNREVKLSTTYFRFWERNCTVIIQYDLRQYAENLGACLLG